MQSIIVSSSLLHTKHIIFTILPYGPGWEISQHQWNHAAVEFETKKQQQTHFTKLVC